MLTITVRGDINKSIRKRLDKAMDQMTDDLKGYLKDATPVDSGYAKSRWKQSDQAVSNDAKYIEPLEDGHSKQAPKGMYEPATKRLKRKWRNKNI